MTDSAKEQFVVVVVELADMVPRRSAELPNVLIAVRTMPKRTGLLESLRKHKFYGRYVRGLLQHQELLPRFETRDEAKRHRDRLAQTFSALGYTVNPVFENQRHVYVLELDGHLLKSKNQHVLYVGETYLETAKRVQNHLRGYKDSPRVKRAFVRHRPDLESGRILHSVWDSKAEEKAWAEKLRNDGFEVISA